MRLGILLLLTLVASPAGLRADEEKTTFEYPLAVGMKWTYDIVSGNGTVVMVAEKEKKVGKKTGIEVVAYVDANASAREVMCVEKGKLFRLSMNDLELDPPLELLSFDAKKGDQWTREFTVSGTKVKTDFDLVIDKIEVPLAKYRDARIVTGNAEDGTNKIVSKVWYASGVGMVKQTVTMNNKELVDLELIKFEKKK
jgi:hypothetical protein